MNGILDAPDLAFLQRTERAEENYLLSDLAVLSSSRKMIILLMPPGLETDYRIVFPYVFCKLEVLYNCSCSSKSSLYVRTGYCATFPRHFVVYIICFQFKASLIRDRRIFQHDLNMSESNLSIGIESSVPRKKICSTALLERVFKIGNVMSSLPNLTSWSG